MKRFSKLLAVVLAIAVIICPMTIFAETSTSSGTYKIALVDANTVQLTIGSTNGFIAYHATVGFNSDTAFQSSYTDADATTGYKNGLKVISYTLATAQANDHNAPTIRAHASGTSLNVIVMPSDTNNLDLCTEIVIGIRVASGTTATLTKIQAADNGTVDSEDANLLTFPAANESTGEIDQTAEYATENAKVVTHTHSFTLTSVQDATTLKTAATCTAAAVYYKTCSCGAVSNDDNDTYTVGEPLGHSFTNYVSDGNATCTQDGTKTAACDHKCGTTKTITDEGSALGHNMTHHDAASSTCLVQGNIEYYSCSRCKKLFANESGATELTAEQIKTALAAHTPSEAVVENDVASTCTTAGHYQEVVYCSVCGVELSRDTYNKELKAHSYGEWTTNADGHSRTCSVCGAVDSGEHDGNPCSVCGYKAAVEPEKITATFNQSASFASSLELNIYVLKLDQLAKASNLFLHAVKDDYSTGSLTTVETEVEVDSMTTVTLGGQQRYRFVFKNFDSRQFGDSITFSVYGVDADGNIIVTSENTYTTCLRTYCLNRMKNNSAQLTEKQLCAEIMNYGAQAQQFFGSGYRTDALVNTGDDIASYIAEYSNTGDRPFTKSVIESGSGLAISNTVNCQTKIEFITAVKASSVSAYAFSDLKYVLTYGGNTIEITSDQFVLQANGYYYGYLDTLNSNQLSTDIEVALYNGDTCISKTRITSIEAYASGQASKSAASFYTAMMKYGDAAVARFG